MNCYYVYILKLKKNFFFCKQKLLNEEIYLALILYSKPFSFLN